MGALIWLIALVSIVYAFFTGQLNWSYFFVIIIVTAVVDSFFSSAEKKAKVVEEEKKEEETLEETYERLMEEIKRKKERQRQEKWSAGPSPNSKPIADAKVVRVTANSLKILRNILLKHHNMKQTDKDYLESKMCQETNNIIAQLNDTIDGSR